MRSTPEDVRRSSAMDVGTPAPETGLRRVRRPTPGRVLSSPPSRRLRRLLVEVHLWLGLALCGVMALWFVSGFVMMYAGYTTRIDEELRLGRMGPLLAEEGWVQVEEAVRRLGMEPEAVQAVRLHRHLERPVWRIQGPAGNWTTVDARSGLPLAPLTPTQAAMLATRYGPDWPAVQGMDSDRAPGVRTLDVADVWTLTAVHEPAFPLYRVDLGDRARTRVYVSRGSGEVVNVHDRRDRVLAFTGAVLHYLYLPQLRRDPGNRILWKWVVVALSALGAVLCVTGIWIGLLYLRSPSLKRASPHLDWSPYRGWMRWHHYTGLIFGLVSFTWVLSGMLSLNPGYSPNRGPSESPTSRLAGGALLASPPPDPSDAIRVLSASVPAFSLRELELRRLAGAPFWFARGEGGETRLILPTQTGSQVRVVERLEGWELERLLPGTVAAPLTDVRWVDEYEMYYYSRSGTRPLPVLRGQFADEKRSWVYLDPATASVALVSDRVGRLHRWGYAFLHTFDTPWLMKWRGVRDPLMILLLVGGTALSVTGIWVSVLWLGRGPRGKRKVKRMGFPRRSLNSGGDLPPGDP